MNRRKAKINDKFMRKFKKILCHPQDHASM